MILIGVIIVIIVIISAFAIERDNDMLQMVGGVSLILSGLALLTYLIFLCFYVGAGYKADMLNREFGTEYTQQEVFWAGGTIEEVRQMKRSRYEIYGDLLRDK